MKKTNSTKGITMVSLVITIVVLLIIGGIVVSTSNINLLDSTKKVASDTEIESDKGILKTAILNAQMKNKNGILTVENLNELLQRYEARAFLESNTIIVEFTKGKRYYEIDENGNINYIEASGAKILSIECKDTSGNLLIKKDYMVLRSSYSLALPEVEGYEPLSKEIQGEIEKDTTIEQVYYMIFDDDTELVFTGLDSSGAVTTSESDIVSYMVGDGSTTAGNGLREKSEQGILKIPDTYNGKPVIKIGQWSFALCSNIKKVITGDNVNKIDNSAFDRNSGIIEIVLGKKVATISTSQTFRNCYNLKTIILESEVSGIAFGYLGGLKNFTQIKVNEENKIYKVEDNVLYSNDGTILYLVPGGKSGEYIVPVGVKTISSYALSNNTKIEKVIISDTVETINNMAFDGNSGIKELTIGKNVTNMSGGQTFRNCSNLKTVTLKTESTKISFVAFSGTGANFTEINVNEDNKTYKVEDNILYSKDGTILYLVPKGRKGELIIPEGVTTINSYAFSGSSKIEKVIISDTVVTINNMAFDGNSAIKEIVIGKNVVNINGNQTFRNCKNLNTVIIDSEAITKLLTAQTSAAYLINNATTIYIKSDITEIGSYVIDNFTIEEVATDDPTYKEGYVKYVKK